MNRADGVNHWDLPVTDFKPCRVDVRVMLVVPRADHTDPAIEGFFMVRRESVQVFDFYRHRPNRAEALRRFA